MRLGAALVPLNPTAPSRRLDVHPRPFEVARVLRDAPILAAKLAGVHAFVRRSRTAVDRAAPRRRRRPAARATRWRRSSTPRARPAGPRAWCSRQRNLCANAWSMAQNFGLARDHAARGAAALPRARVRVRPDDRAHHRRSPRVRRSVRSVRVGRGHPRARGRRSRAWCRRCCRALLQVKVTAERVPSLRAILVSSAPLGVDLARDFEHAHEDPAGPGLGPLGVHQLRVLHGARRRPGGARRA